MIAPVRTAHPISPSELLPRARELFDAGFRLALAAAHDEGASLRAVYLFLAAAPERRVELVVTVPAGRPALPSLAGLSFPASRFEREMQDLYGIVPLDHPLPRRLVRHAHWPAGWHPMRRDAGPPPTFDHETAFPFLEVGGEGVCEIPVGPVHAGLIEPGHFRFSVVGEAILKLKARLWFTHRGVEKLFEGLPADGGVRLAERISGDTSAAHALAHVLAVEDALGIEVPDDTHRLRALLVELERLYNHVTDLGALANDVGFSLANSHAQHLREQHLRLNACVTGSRLLRDALVPGGARLRSLPDTGVLRSLAAEVAEIAALTVGHGLIRDRFAGTAILTEAQARELGCLGYVARASGVATDARAEHPSTPLPVRPVVLDSGDVLARYEARVREYAASASLAGDLAAAHNGPLSLPAADARTRARGLRSGVGIVEGWRGTIVHRVEIGENDTIVRAKVVDPSWFNWPALPVALADAIVADFPLANKSFNLSYAGNDL